MVGANTFREPALTAKMATTLDHISGGRAILGIGGAWFETEHEAYGLEFGSGLPERLRWLGEALPIMRGMLHGERPTAAGPRYVGDRRPQRPAAGPGAPAAADRRRRRAGDAQAGRPLRRREQRRRRLRERQAQGGHPRSGIARRSGATRPRSSGRPASAPSIIRDSRAEADRVHAAMFERNGHADRWTDQPVGTPEDVAERLLPFLDIGYRHLDRRVPVAPRRGIDDAVRDGGPTDPRASLTTRVREAHSGPGAPRRIGSGEADLALALAGRVRGGRAFARAVARGLRPIAAGRHVAPAAAARA